MQKNDATLKRRILVDGEEIPGLVETNDINDADEVVDVPGFNRIIPIKSGVKKLDPIDLVYKRQKDTITAQFYHNWFSKDEDHDVVIINTDGTGQEMNRWLLRDCECTKYNERSYNAAGVEFSGIAVTIICNTPPVRIQE